MYHIILYNLINVINQIVNINQTLYAVFRIYVTPIKTCWVSFVVSWRWYDIQTCR